MTGPSAVPTHRQPPTAPTAPVPPRPTTTSSPAAETTPSPHPTPPHPKPSNPSNGVLPRQPEPLTPSPLTTIGDAAASHRPPQPSSLRVSSALTTDSKPPPVTRRCPRRHVTSPAPPLRSAALRQHRTAALGQHRDRSRGGLSKSTTILICTELQLLKIMLWSKGGSHMSAIGQIELYYEADMWDPQLFHNMIFKSRSFVQLTVKIVIGLCNWFQKLQFCATMIHIVIVLCKNKRLCLLYTSF